MLLRNLFEATKNEVAIIFGRFNPPHKGHKAAWEMASKTPVWFIGTNRDTQGLKDPLPFDVKVQAMKAIWPEIEGHVIAETSWLTMASKVFKEYPDSTLLCFTDEDWVTKTIIQYNGKEGPHGFYNFKNIEHKSTPRLSSATDLRNAVEKGDKEKFSRAAGVNADTEVAGKPFFDLVSKYLLPYIEKEKEKISKKKKKEPEVQETRLMSGPDDDVFNGESFLDRVIVEDLRLESLDKRFSLWQKHHITEIAMEDDAIMEYFPDRITAGIVDNETKNAVAIIMYDAEAETFPNAVEITHIQTSPKYRGKGFAKYLYNLLRRDYTIISDQDQSTGGAAMWANMAREGIPIQGWIEFSANRTPEEMDQEDPKSNYVEQLKQIGAKKVERNSRHPLYVFPVTVQNGKLDTPANTKIRVYQGDFTNRWVSGLVSMKGGKNESIDQDMKEGIGGMIAGGIGQFVGNKIDPLHGEIMRAHGEMAGRKAEYTIRKYMHLLQKALKQQLDSDDKKDEEIMKRSYTTEKQILTRIRQIMYDRKLSGTESNAGELNRLKQQLKDIRSQQSVSEGVDIGKEWMSDTELDQYVPERLQQQWRELLGYDKDGNPSALWANITGGYEPDVRDPQHRALMVKVANKWFAMKKIPNVKFYDVKDADDELEWLVQIGEQDVGEGWSDQDDWGGLSKREFKRRELQHELGHEDDPEFQRMMREKDRGPWYIKIDGKIFKQKGEPKAFDWKRGANNYALAILKNRPELKGKIFLTKKREDTLESKNDY